MRLIVTQCVAAIGRFIKTFAFISSVGDFRIAGIDGDGIDPLIGDTVVDRNPSATAIGALENALSAIRARRTCINDLRIGSRHGDSINAGRWSVAFPMSRVRTDVMQAGQKT